ncbi:MAG: cysteine--tRNA ligase [Firmicutes bacterium]|nr:cysteine--tRNA ligase [Bacillota bacterium]
MGLRVYNTLTRTKQDFVPRTPGRVDIYQCGITPYDYTHMGHARQYVFWDTVRRYLRWRGFEVFCVQNVTDVDDKIIAKANERGTSPAEVAAEYHEDFLDVMDRLGVERPDVFPKVTEHIQDIIRVIEGLVEKGYAYQVDGDVFFDVTRFPGYGKLSRRSPDEMMAGARVEVDPRKRNAMDFALWKASKPGEPAWDSPWGPGRPGWHIECSALALKYLGSGFDFHGGGDELIFPHHENEIAQSEAYTGQEPFARYFVHHAMLNVGDAKMSKSLGNFFAVRDVLRQYEPGVIRYYFASRHYRSPASYSTDELEAARRAYERLRSTLDAARRRIADTDTGRTGASGRASQAPVADEALETSGDDGLSKAASEAWEKFIQGMDDDFNTAVALAAVHDLARSVNDALHSGSEVSRGGLRRAVDTMEELGGILGLFGEKEEGAADSEMVDGLVELLVQVRGELRAKKEWALADRIRDGLREMGIVLEDTASGTVWKREK